MNIWQPPVARISVGVCAEIGLSPCAHRRIYRSCTWTSPARCFGKYGWRTLDVHAYICCSLTFAFFGRLTRWGHGVPRWHSDTWWGSKQGAFLFLLSSCCKIIGYQDIDDPESVSLDLTLKSTRDLSLLRWRESVSLFIFARKDDFIA